MKQNCGLIYFHTCKLIIESNSGGYSKAGGHSNTLDEFVESVGLGRVVGELGGYQRDDLGVEGCVSQTHHQCCYQDHCQGGGQIGGLRRCSQIYTLQYQL